MSLVVWARVYSTRTRTVEADIFFEEIVLLEMYGIIMKIQE